MNMVDAFSEKPVNALTDAVLVHDYFHQKVFMVSAESLLASFKNQLAEGTHLLHLKISAECRVGVNVELLTLEASHYIWSTLVSQLHCPLSAEFRELYLQYSIYLPAYDAALEQITPDLKKRLQFLIFDMLHLKQDERLEWDLLQPRQNTHEIEMATSLAKVYLSSLYFSVNEQKFLWSFPTPSGHHFHELVAHTMASKFAEPSAAASSTGAHVCSSHDIAPLFRSVFRLESAFYKAAQFDAQYKAFNRELVKQMASASAAAAAAASAATSHSAASSSSSSASSASDIGHVESSLDDSTPQVQKLKVLVAQREALSQAGAPIDRKLQEKINRLQKEVRRMANKRR
jgi:hypothetical protein